MIGIGRISTQPPPPPAPVDDSEILLVSAYYSLGDLDDENVPLLFPSIIVNVGNCFDPGTGIFTTPENGTYRIKARLTIESSGPGDLESLFIVVQSSTTEDWDQITATAAITYPLTVDKIIQLSANREINLVFNHQSFLGGTFAELVPGISQSWLQITQL